MIAWGMSWNWTHIDDAALAGATFLWSTFAIKAGLVVVVFVPLILGKYAWALIKLLLTVWLLIR
jgi:hypothetical protein